MEPPGKYVTAYVVRLRTYIDLVNLGISLNAVLWTPSPNLPDFVVTYLAGSLGPSRIPPEDLRDLGGAVGLDARKTMLILVCLEARRVVISTNEISGTNFRII
jgi:hypothetical protein